MWHAGKALLLMFHHAKLVGRFGHCDLQWVVQLITQELQRGTNGSTEHALVVTYLNLWRSCHMLWNPQKGVHHAASKSRCQCPPWSTECPSWSPIGTVHPWKTWLRVLMALYLHVARW